MLLIENLPIQNDFLDANLIRKLKCSFDLTVVMVDFIEDSEAHLYSAAFHVSLSFTNV